jgi:hypothetical protein
MDNSREITFHCSTMGLVQNSAIVEGYVHGNRNAPHPVNAILICGYAALESEIRIKAISEGYDSTVGTMH